MLAEKHSNDYFIAKAFILLADIYLAQDNIFQARGVLEGVIENYEGEELVNIARKKWEFIIEEDQSNNEINSKQQSFIEISEDDVEYVINQVDENYIVPISERINSSVDSLKLINENVLEDEFK